MRQLVDLWSLTLFIKISLSIQIQDDHHLRVALLLGDEEVLDDQVLVLLDDF